MRDKSVTQLTWLQPTHILFKVSVKGKRYDQATRVKWSGQVFSVRTTLNKLTTATSTDAGNGLLTSSK